MLAKEMFYKAFLILIIIFFSFNDNLNASDKENIIKNLKDINNLTFNFEQNINGEIETGNCVLEYPKKMGPAREPIKYEELLIN